MKGVGADVAPSLARAGRERGPALLWVCVALHVVGACEVEERATDTARHAAVGGKTVDQVFSDQRVAALGRAACVGDLQGVSAAVGSGVDVNARGYEGVTPLIWAQSCGQPEWADRVIAMLQERGVHFPVPRPGDRPSVKD